jgi:hypothetical protein
MTDRTSDLPRTPATPSYSMTIDGVSSDVRLTIGADTNIEGGVRMTVIDSDGYSVSILISIDDVVSMVEFVTLIAKQQARDA